jgi:hypothetical protein
MKYFPTTQSFSQPLEPLGPQAIMAGLTTPTYRHVSRCVHSSQHGHCHQWDIISTLAKDTIGVIPVTKTLNYYKTKKKRKKRGGGK